MEKRKLKMIRGSKERPEDVKEKLSEWGALTIFTDMDWLMNEHILFYVSDRKSVVGVFDNDSILECLNYKEETLPPLPEKKVDEEIELPKSWEEFCNNYRLKDEWYFNSDSALFPKCDCGKFRNYENDKNLLPNEETAKAVLALCQLIQLRDCYNNGWQPNWKDVFEDKYCIAFFEEDILTPDCSVTHKESFLIFKTAELRDEFLKNFKDLIKQIHPLFGIMKGGEKCKR